jgi:hypothetical protein
METDFKIESLELSKDLKGLPVLAQYDEAFRTLLSQVFAGSVILAPTDRALELYINQQKDDIHFPFISIFPSGGYTRENKNYALSNIGDPRNRLAKLYEDDTLKFKGYSENMQNFYQVQYFNISYDLVCWGNNRVQALQLIQELCFWLQSQGEVLIQYKGQTFRANLILNDVITDNSSYVTYSDIGDIYLFSFKVDIQAPVFRTQNYLNITSSDITLTLKDVNE